MDNEPPLPPTVLKGTDTSAAMVHFLESEPQRRGHQVPALTPVCPTKSRAQLSINHFLKFKIYRVSLNEL